ncbi:hypothetical protein Tco_0731307 [Tanacetum coccineum]
MAIEDINTPLPSSINMEKLFGTGLKRNVTATDVWKILVDLFHNNKEALSMELHEDLLSFEIGSLTISEYFKKIKRGFGRFGDQFKFVHSRGSHIGIPSQWVSQNRSPAPHQYARRSQVVSKPNLHASWVDNLPSLKPISPSPTVAFSAQLHTILCPMVT